MTWPALSAKPRPLIIGNGRARAQDLTAAGTYLLAPGFAQQQTAAGTNGPFGMFDVNGPDLALEPKSSFLRLRVRTTTNATAPGTSWYYALFPVTAVAGGANLNSFTLGAEVPQSSTPTHNTPAASTILPAVESADFATPADGLYVVGLVLAAALAANSSLQVAWNVGALNL